MRIKLSLSIILLLITISCSRSPSASPSTPAPNSLPGAAGLAATPVAAAPTLETQAVYSPLVTVYSPLVTAEPTLEPSTVPTEILTEPVTPVPTVAPTAAATPEPTLVPSPTITPTYAVLRGEVLELANCRYGPGAPYLYKYALIAGSNLNVIGRNDLGTWILVQAIGGHNPCWVKASLMNVKGDVMSVAPTTIPLPMSPYYGPLSGVWAERSGDEVKLSWNSLSLRAGDDSEQFPYLVEAWLCQGGRLVFTPIGSYTTIVNVTDEAGCSEPSHGRVYGVEKHGYTRWVEFPWPAHP